MTSMHLLGTQDNPSKHTICLLVALAALLVPTQEMLAASITIDSLNLEGTDVLNGFNASFQSEGGGTPENPLKIFGDASFVSNGTDAEITLQVAGSVTAAAGDRIQADYDFTTNLTGGNASWMLGGEILLLLDFPFSVSEGPIEPGVNSYDGGGTTVALPFPVDDVGFEGELVIHWNNAQAGDELSVTIPNNSIDFWILSEVELPPLLGDYNLNGAVDAPDYIVWRDTFGQQGDDLAADGNENGTVDAPDYIVWRDNFGNTQDGIQVPEPSTALGLAAVVMFVSTFVRRRPT